MQCKRHGCPKKFRRKGFKTYVFDERKTIPTKMFVNRRNGEVERPNKFFEKDYAGHVELWCESCYLMYEGFSYQMFYYVDDKKVKFKRKALPADLAGEMPNTITNAIKDAPIVEG